MSTIDHLKSESKKIKKRIKEQVVKISEYIEDIEEMAIECDEEDLVCVINQSKSKITEKIRK